MNEPRRHPSEYSMPERLRHRSNFETAVSAFGPTGLMVEAADYIDRLHQLLRDTPTLMLTGDDLEKLADPQFNKYVADLAEWLPKALAVVGYPPAETKPEAPKFEPDHRRFPILPENLAGVRLLQAAGVTPLRAIPWSMIAPHEAQAMRNHDGLSLEVLARRSGLSASEAVAVLEDRPWRAMGTVAAHKRLLELFIAAADAGLKSGPSS